MGPTQASSPRALPGMLPEHRTRSQPLASAARSPWLLSKSDTGERALLASERPARIPGLQKGGMPVGGLRVAEKGREGAAGKPVS